MPWDPSAPPSLLSVIKHWLVLSFDTWCCGVTEFSLFLDEEIGGVKGMREFVKLDEFKTMNVGFALDEGIGSINMM